MVLPLALTSTVKRVHRVAWALFGSFGSFGSLALFGSLAEVSSNDGISPIVTSSKLTVSAPHMFDSRTFWCCDPSCRSVARLRVDRPAVHAVVGTWAADGSRKVSYRVRRCIICSTII